MTVNIVLISCRKKYELLPNGDFAVDEDGEKKEYKEEGETVFIGYTYDLPKVETSAECCLTTR